MNFSLQILDPSYVYHDHHLPDIDRIFSNSSKVPAFASTITCIKFQGSDRSKIEHIINSNALAVRSLTADGK